MAPITDFILAMFPASSDADKELVVGVLLSLGIDTEADLQYLQEADIAGTLKPVHARKLMEFARHAASEHASPGSRPVEPATTTNSSQTSDKTRLLSPEKHAPDSSTNAAPTSGCHSNTVTSQQLTAGDDSERKETTKKLAIATGVLGSVGVAAVPLAIFAALFPPITLPIAVVVGVGAGAVVAATATTGIATAVMVHKGKAEQPLPQPPPYSE